MIDDRIGSIGSTQGVNDSSTPASRNTPATVNRLRDCSALAKRPVSGAAAGGAARVGGRGAADGAADVAAVGAAAPSTSATVATAQPPATGFRSNACVA